MSWPSLVDLIGIEVVALIELVSVYLTALFRKCGGFTLKTTLSQVCFQPQLFESVTEIVPFVTPEFRIKNDEKVEYCFEGRDSRFVRRSG